MSVYFQFPLLGSFRLEREIYYKRDFFQFPLLGSMMKEEEREEIYYEYFQFPLLGSYLKPSRIRLKGLAFNSLYWVRRIEQWKYWYLALQLLSIPSIGFVAISINSIPT